MNTQKPNRQRQVAALKDHSRNNRGLVMARVALKGFATFTGQDAVSTVIALRTAECTPVCQAFFGLAENDC